MEHGALRWAAGSGARRLAVVSALGAVVVWSTNALAAGAALEELSLVQVLALQFGAAAVVFATIRAAGARRRDPAAPRRRLTSRSIGVAVVGLTGAIALQYLAFATAPLVAANAVAYAWPLMVAAWAALAPGRDGSSASMALAIVGLVGVVMIFAQRGGDASAPAVGYVAALGSALAMAWYTLSIGRLSASRGDLLLVATGAGAAVTIPAAVMTSEAWPSPTAVALGLYTGLGPMAAGYALWTAAMSHPSAARLAPIAYATPLLSTLLLLASGEQLSALGLIGCALIILCAAGVVLDVRGPRTASTTGISVRRQRPRRRRLSRGAAGAPRAPAPAAPGRARAGDGRSRP